jgi:hypothetical protein
VPPFPLLQPDADIRIPDAGSSEEISPAQGRTKAVRAGERIDLSLYHAILSEHILPPTSGDDIRVRLFELRRLLLGELFGRLVASSLGH